MGANPVILWHILLYFFPIWGKIRHIYGNAVVYGATIDVFAKNTVLFWANTVIFGEITVLFGKKIVLFGKKTGVFLALLLLSDTVVFLGK